MGAAEVRLDRLDRAEGILRQAFGARDFPSVRQNLGVLHAWRGDMSAAIEMTREALARGGERARSNLAWLLSATGKGVEAQAEFSRSSESGAGA